MKLLSLELKSFRGATQPIKLHFSKEKNITLIYAENGNGKTSISDALVCLCTDKYGSLSDKSGADVSFLKSLDAKNSDLSIELTTDSGILSAKLHGNTNRLVKSSSCAVPRLSALRRAQICSFIEENASGRYKQLASFIDVSNIQKAEMELKKLIGALSSEFTGCSSSLVSAEKTLNEIWAKEAKTEDVNFNDWIKREINRDLSTDQEECSQNDLVIKNWNSLTALVASIKAEREQLSQAERYLTKSQTDLTNYSEKNIDSESDALKLLQEARTFLQSRTSISKCPICDKDNNKDHLLSEVVRRIENMIELEKLVTIQSRASSERDRLHHRLQSQIEPFNNLLINFKNSCDKLSKFKFENLCKKITTHASTKENYSEFQNSSLELASEIAKLTDYNQGLRESIGRINSIKQSQDTIVKLSELSNNLEQLLTNAKASLLILEDSRKRTLTMN